MENPIFDESFIICFEKNEKPGNFKVDALKGEKRKEKIKFDDF